MPLPFKSIVILSTADWDNPFWTNKQHVANELGKLGIKVLYFESTGLRAPSSKSKSDILRIIKRLLRFFRGVKKVQDNVWVFSPLVIPKHSNPIVAKLNNLLMKLYIRFFSWLLGISKEYIWTYNPLSYEYIQGLGSKIIYHSVDDLSAAPGLPHEQINAIEPKLLQKSFLTLVTAQKLKDKYSQVIPQNVFYHSNVADYDHFNSSKKLNSLPEDLLNIPRPLVGFVGAISDYKLDFKLLAYLADNRPDVSFILIGKIGEGQPGTDHKVLVERKNIHLIGPRPYSELPHYLSCFDAVLLPCPINDYTRSMFPMKFFEYLAAGKQIIATEIPAILEHEKYYHLARNKEEFLSKLNNVLDGNNLISSELIDQLARQFTYETRTKKMLDLISSKN